ncbi:hypothetical protein BG015_007932 [Linnemannia schmuckeri]|uniref:Uncharacterized protein n=1 Tax=Linnemannia schmuckeri TaxID=64567 RepID=A0A9P5S192_9FUNG|nr:hypothetical protein BG015_007932 [Linnemannia schmuckeri]
MFSEPFAMSHPRNSFQVMLKLKVAILVVLLGTACTALPMAQLEKRYTPKQNRKPSLYQLCLQNHHGLDLLKGSIKDGFDDLYDDGGATEASGFIPYPTDGRNPYDTSICFADPEAEKQFSQTGKIIVGDGSTDIGDGHERNHNTANYCPVPSILAQAGSPKALCTFKNMNVQAKFRIKKLQFKNCAFKECKLTKSKTATTTTEVKGEVKFAAEIFKVYNLEATLSGGVTNSYTFTTTEEQNSAKGDSAFEIGVSVIVQTTVDSISIAGKDPKTGVCTENACTTKAPIKNTYVLAEHTQNLWISCDNIKMPGAPATPPATKAPAKRQDNQVGTTPGSADTAPAEGTVTAPAEGADAAPAEGTVTAPAEGADTAPAEGADTAPAGPATEETWPTYEEIFGDEEEDDDECFSYENGMFFPELCY